MFIFSSETVVFLFLIFAVYFTGNLAHTKGKGINTMRGPRTPTRTITLAKVQHTYLHYYCWIISFISTFIFYWELTIYLFYLNSYVAAKKLSWLKAPSLVLPQRFLSVLLLFQLRLKLVLFFFSTLFFSISFYITAIVS